jgi:hypothetical protein
LGPLGCGFFYKPFDLREKYMQLVGFVIGDGVCCPQPLAFL